MARRQRSRGQGTLYRRNERGPWLARWHDHSGRRRESSTGTTDRAAAERILGKRIADSALRKDGVIDARADQFYLAERKPIAEHLKDWTAALTAKGVSAKQVVTVRVRVESLLAVTKAERLSGLSASAMQNAIGDLHAAGKGKSLQTCQHYLRAIKQFSRWLRRDGRTRDDALAHLAGFNAATDRRYERRALSAEELAALIDATEVSPTWGGMAGADRAMLYRVATGTGFRANELRSLTPASFDLDADPPVVALRAEHSKRRREDRQPIRDDLADTIAPWLEGKPDDSPVFADMPEKTAAMPGRTCGGQKPDGSRRHTIR